MRHITSEEIVERIELIKPITLKNVVMGRGHDCGGLIADVYFKRKHIANYHDDGWGGEPEVTYLKPEYKDTLENFIKEIKFEEHLQSTDWSDFKSKIGTRTSIDVAIEFLASQSEQLKRVRKLQTKALVLEKHGAIYTKKFKVSIAQIKKNPLWLSSFKTSMQESIDEGFRVLNTNI